MEVPTTLLKMLYRTYRIFPFVFILTILFILSKTETPTRFSYECFTRLVSRDYENKPRELTLLRILDAVPLLPPSETCASVKHTCRLHIQETFTQTPG